jgi:hypothetical protein
LKILVGSQGITDSNLEILKTYLVRENLAARDGDLLKFQTIKNKGRAPVITATDHGIVTIASTIATLSCQIEQLIGQVCDMLLQQKIEKSNTDCKSALRDSKTTQAKYHLVSRKRLDAILTDRTKSLSSIEAIYSKIQQSHSDAEVCPHPLSYDRCSTRIN